MRGLDRGRQMDEGQKIIYETQNKSPAKQVIRGTKHGQGTKGNQGVYIGE